MHLALAYCSSFSIRNTLTINWYDVHWYAKHLTVTFLFLAATTECLFPEYVQSPPDESGFPMPWRTKVWLLNLRNEPKVREMQDVYVQRSNIWSQRTKNRWPCDRKTRHVKNRATSGISGSCSEKKLLYNRTCLTEERFNHFKVIEYGAEG